MAPQPAPGTGAPPTGNALSDANSQAAATPFLTPSELATLGTGLSGNISECLWPPQGSTWGIGTGLIHLQFGVPCLFTKSEARAALGAFILLGGVSLMGFGLMIYAGASALPILARVGAGAGGAVAAGAIGAEADESLRSEPNPRDQPIAPPTRTASRHVREGRAPTEAEARKANQELAS